MVKIERVGLWSITWPVWTQPKVLTRLLFWPNPRLDWVLTRLLFWPTQICANLPNCQLYSYPHPQAGVVHQKGVRTSHGKEKACSILTVNSTRKLTINWQQILALLIYTSRANLITLLFRISEVLFVYKYFIKEFLY